MIYCQSNAYKSWALAIFVRTFVEHELKKKPKEILNSYKTIHLNELHWYFAFILKCIREIDSTWNALFDALPTQNELSF